MPISPILLTIKAFFAASDADFFSNQNPIKRKDERPTSSQNIYIIRRLCVRTMPSIEKSKYTEVSEIKGITFIAAHVFNGKEMHEKTD